jgi:Flp pilus assembly protein TadD
MAAIMIRSAKFWISLSAFQIAFGVAVFAVTRHYYMVEEARTGADRTEAREPAVPAWPDPVTGVNPALLEGFSAAPRLDDPAALSRQADEAFGSKQYDRAALQYAQLLTLAPDNVEIYNNLGLTLYYLGRSAEALSKLNEGIAVDPMNQRIWLTTGFVNAQLGNIADARLALTNAVAMDPNNDVGQSAASMLDNLPQ